MFDAGNGHPYFFSCTFSLVPILPGAFPVPQWWDQYGQDTARFLPGGGKADTKCCEAGRGHFRHSTPCCQNCRQRWCHPQKRREQQRCSRQLQIGVMMTNPQPSDLTDHPTGGFLVAYCSLPAAVFSVLVGSLYPSCIPGQSIIYMLQIKIFIGPLVFLAECVY